MAEHKYKVIWITEHEAQREETYTADGASLQPDGTMVLLKEPSNLVKLAPNADPPSMELVGHLRGYISFIRID